MNMEDVLLDRLLAEHLMQEIDQLPVEFRSALVLCDFMEFSYKEIAEILDCPVGTVMSRLYRGRRMLHKRIQSLAGSQDADSSDTVKEVATDLEAFRRRKGRL